MSTRLSDETKIVLPDGSRYTLTLIENPTVDDVIISEMKVQAQSVAEKTSTEGRQVPRDLRDFLVRLGVER